MCNTYLDLILWRPKFVGQKAYCNETRAWYIAARSCNGIDLVWRRKYQDLFMMNEVS